MPEIKVSNSVEDSQRLITFHGHIDYDSFNYVSDVAFLPNEDGVITISDDNSIRIWVKREAGPYWPSICQFLTLDSTAAVEYNDYRFGSQCQWHFTLGSYFAQTFVIASCTAMCFSPQKRIVFIGLDTGLIEEFKISEDCNQLIPVRQFTGHRKGITSCIYSHEKDVLISCSKDKCVSWYYTQSGPRLGAYTAPAQPTCLEYDEKANYFFAGMNNHEIVIIKMDKNSYQYVATLKGHGDTITCLCWDPLQKILFSGSKDNCINMWDIGGQKGEMIQLQGHQKRIVSIDYYSDQKKLFSISANGRLVLWDVTAPRMESAVWSYQDHCEKCKQPFFWNLKDMWDKKLLGTRRHHCRKCGKSVCISCASRTSKMPLYGFETEVRVCDDCFKSISPDDLTSYAEFHHFQHAVEKAKLDWAEKRCVTTGGRKIQIWNIEKLLK